MLIEWLVRYERKRVGESATVEYKTSARWNALAAQGPDKKMEQIISKTVAAFLNTAGGTLVIGVEDNGNVYGLADDYLLGQPIYRGQRMGKVVGRRVGRTTC